MADRRPHIVFTQYTQYIAVDVERMEDEDGTPHDMGTVTTLCRCGDSSFKPFCDGTHSSNGFVGTKEDDRVPDEVKEYPGDGITVVDNRGVCSHGGECLKALPGVFDLGKRPWIDVSAATKDVILDAIRLCPSGALSYRLDGGERIQEFGQTRARIVVKKDGPFEVQGGIGLQDDLDNTPECPEHYCLCRCGSSRNKPFCDGQHADAGFQG